MALKQSEEKDSLQLTDRSGSEVDTFFSSVMSKICVSNTFIVSLQRQYNTMLYSRI